MLIAEDDICVCDVKRMTFKSIKMVLLPVIQKVAFNTNSDKIFWQLGAFLKCKARMCSNCISID